MSSLESIAQSTQAHARAYRAACTSGADLTDLNLATHKERARSAYRAFAQSDVVLVLGVGAFEFSALMDSIGAEMSLEAKVPMIICLHPFVDSRSSIKQYQYEAGAELGVIALLLSALASKSSRLPSLLAELVGDLDIGHIASESAIAEEELEDIARVLQQASKPMIFIGESFLRHQYAGLISKACAVIGECALVGGACAVVSCYFDEARSDEELDSSDITQMIQALANLPESNGALVYLSPFDEENLASPVLYATEMFLRLSKLEQGVLARLVVDSTEVACVIKQVEYLKGAMAVLKGWDMQGRGLYPFITARFAQNGGYNG